MGEVWRAKDTRLDRSVAIKVLPAAFSTNAQLKLRFEREAKTISQLTHPNICTLYDVGHDGDVDFLVMELIDGESLAERLARGPLALADVLRHGAEIAEALAQAHQQGVVHRDLKPGNVMLTKSGAKLLDFGLSKSAAAVVSTSDRTVTQEKPLTEEGTVLGTFQYMAPEQVAGENADARSDIFSLGAVLYEMATGRRAFEGKNRTSVVAAIIGGEPRPMRELQPLTPPVLEHVVAKCLEKDADRRWQSAADVAHELRWIASAGSQAGVAAPVIVRRRNRERLAWMLHAVTAIVAATAAWAWFAHRQPPKQMTEAYIPPPPGYRILSPVGGAVLAPDATALVAVVGDGAGTRLLAVRPMATSGFRFLPGTDDAQFPFWSPDGQQVGFFASGKLKTINLAGGQPQEIADAPTPRGGAWSPNGLITFAPDPHSPLMKIAAAGGTAVPATRLGAGETSHRWPTFLEDGEHFVYVSVANTIALQRGSLNDANERTLFVSGSAFGLPTRSGWFFFARNRSLFAQRYDGLNPPHGEAVMVSDDVTLATSGLLCVSAANDGTLIMQHGSGFAASELVWVDRTGRELEPALLRGTIFSPSLSHDGRRVAYDLSDSETGSGDIWVLDLQRKRSARLTFDPGNESAPLWSPDDKRIVYDGDGAGQDDLYEIASGGTGTPELLLKNRWAKRFTDFSADGRWIIFNSSATRNALAGDIWVYSTASKTARPWLATPFDDSGGRLSPDGRWMAYESNESGRTEVYVRAFPDADEKWLVSVNGGGMPGWRGDGGEIFYVSRDRKMMAATVRLGKTFEADTPKELFTANVRTHHTAQYAVTPDGSRFLLNRIVEDTEARPITVVLNWQPRPGK